MSSGKSCFPFQGFVFGCDPAHVCCINKKIIINNINNNNTTNTDNNKAIKAKKLRGDLAQSSVLRSSSYLFM